MNGIDEDNQRQALLIAYLVGIIDGEGCIGIHRNKGPGQYYVRVSVGMAHKGTIDLLHDTFGGIKFKEGRSKYPNAQPIYRWNVMRRDDVVSFLDRVEPLLRIKTRQAALARQWLATKVRKLDCKPGKLSEQELQRREDMFQLMHVFNAVGAAATTNWDDTGDGEVIV